MGGQTINVGGHHVSKEHGHMYLGVIPVGGAPVPPPKPGSKGVGAGGAGSGFGTDGAGGQGRGESLGNGQGAGEWSSQKGVFLEKENAFANLNCA